MVFGLSLHKNIGLTKANNIIENNNEDIMNGIKNNIPSFYTFIINRYHVYFYALILAISINCD